MSDPSNYDYLNMLNGNAPSGWTFLTSKTNTTNGLSAAAYYNAARQIVMVFQGLSTPSGGNGANVSDAQVMAGELPSDLLVSAQGFVADVQAAAAAKQGEGTQLSFSASNVFVAGNSLGGLVAQWLSENDQYGGASYRVRVDGKYQPSMRHDAPHESRQGHSLLDVRCRTGIGMNL